MKQFWNRLKYSVTLRLISETFIKFWFHALNLIWGLSSQRLESFNGLKSENIFFPSFFTLSKLNIDYVSLIVTSSCVNLVLLNLGSWEKVYNRTICYFMIIRRCNGNLWKYIYQHYLKLVLQNLFIVIMKVSYGLVLSLLLSVILSLSKVKRRQRINGLDHLAV